MTREVYIKAQIIDTLPSGQKRVKLLANDCDGIEICTDDVVEDFTPTTHLIKYWTERKQGLGVEHIPHCKCANCDTDYLPRMAMAMNYCPNCGARFVKEREDNEAD